MISIHNSSNPIVSSSSISRVLKPTPRLHEKNPETESESINKTTNKLRQYSEIAEESQQKQSYFTPQAKLPYSTLSAINQYTHNANLEHIEKTNELLGLSIYA